MARSRESWERFLEPGERLVASSVREPSVEDRRVGMETRADALKVESIDAVGIVEYPLLDGTLREQHFEQGRFAQIPPFECAVHTRTERV